jgi:hemolysin activation/secretion protein
LLRARHAGAVATTRRASFSLAALSLLLTVAGSPELAAQTPGKGSIVPELTEQQFEAKANEAKRGKRLDLRLPAMSRPRPAASTKALFVLKAVELAGVTTFSRDEMAESYRALLGRPVSELDLLHIVERITERYRQSGFVLSRAILSPQDVDNGRLRITVLEGRIDDIVLKGDGAERFSVRRLLQPMLAQRPLRLETLERRLLLVSDTPGVRISDVSIDEIGEATGSFRLVVHVQTWRVWAGLDLDNRGTPAIGPLQAFIATAFNSQAFGGETLAVNLSTNPDEGRELRFGSLLLDAPLGSDGARFGLSASYSDIWPGDERRATHGHIQTESYVMSGSIASLRAQDASLWLSAIAAIRNEEESSSLGTVYQDRIRAIGFRAAYQLHDAFQGSNYMVLNIRRGLDILGASEKGSALLSRADGSGEFSKAHISLTRLQKLSEQWALVLSGAAQVSSTGLLASEEFYLGGAQFGRAFRTGDVGGDAGLAAFAEVRFEQRLENPFIRSYQLYGFVDTGTVWDRSTGGDRISLSSFGGGLRLSLHDSLVASLEIAAPMGDYSASSSDGGPTVFFTLSRSFKSCPDQPILFCPAN